jgi:hypothetical protein
VLRPWPRRSRTITRYRSAKAGMTLAHASPVTVNLSPEEMLGIGVAETRRAGPEKRAH